MPSSYPEQLAEWVKQRESKKGPSRVSEFLAVRDDVEAAITAGFDIKAIWSEMRESKRVNVGYSTFLAYVTRYSSAVRSVPLNKPTKSGELAQASSAILTPRPDQKAPKKESLPSTNGFTFNSNPRKEDLI